MLGVYSKEGEVVEPGWVEAEQLGKVVVTEAGNMWVCIKEQRAKKE